MLVEMSLHGVFNCEALAEMCICDYDDVLRGRIQTSTVRRCDDSSRPTCLNFST
jgi:hypothetical protein